MDAPQTPERVTVHIPMTLKRSCGRRRIIAPAIIEDETQGQGQAHPQIQPTPLALALAKAHRWQRWLDEGRYRDVNALAEALTLESSYVHRVLRLTLLAPDIIEAILDRREPDGLTLATVRGALPLVWEEQRALLGFARSAR